MNQFRVLLVFLLTLLFAGSLFAQHKKGVAAKISEKQTEKMKVELELEGAQIPKVQQINLKYAEQILQAMDENKWNPDEEEDKISSIKNERSAELKKVLTKKQWEAYEIDRTKKK